MLDTQQIYEMHFIVKPQYIGFFKFILEGYDGMTTLSTINAKNGEIVVRYVVSFKNDLLAIVDEYEQFIKMVYLNDDIN